MTLENARELSNKLQSYKDKGKGFKAKAIIPAPENYLLNDYIVSILEAKSREEVEDNLKHLSFNILVLYVNHSTDMFVYDWFSNCYPDVNMESI